MKTDMEEVTKKVQDRLGGKGSYAVTEWLVTTVIEVYEESRKPEYYKPLRNGILQT